MWHRHAQQPACFRLLSSLPTLAEERRLRGEDGDMDGDMDGEIDGEIVVERNNNRRTGGVQRNSSNKQ